MFCANCGAQNESNAWFCVSCGFQFTPINSAIICPRCNSSNPIIQTVSEDKPWSCIGALFFIFLLLLPIIGWIVLFIRLVARKDTRTVTYATCQNCAHRWEIN